MDPRLSGDPTIVVSTADPELLDHALSVVAAAGLEAEVTSDPGFLRARWRSAAMLLVGVDQAPALAELRLPRRAEVYLLTETGTEHRRRTSGRCRWARPSSSCRATSAGCPGRSPT